MDEENPEKQGEEPQVEPEPEQEPEESKPEDKQEFFEPVPQPLQEHKSSNKRTKIQVDPNASVKETAENCHYLTALPVLPESTTPYTPVLYTFRVKTRGKSTRVKKMSTKPPPFYILFDHTIAVIWTLFNKDISKDNLGIVQLQWALHFLESIHNNNGIHPQDIQLCIDAIQNYLIDEYAEISEESVMYNCYSRLDDTCRGEDKTKQSSFSVNYCQMMKKCPLVCNLDSKESTIIDRQLLEELENVKKVVGIESIDLTKVVSKDQVMNILNEWKKEQIDKINEELKMLHVVEDMMKNSDSQNFEGYTDEKQFETVFKRN